MGDVGVFLSEDKGNGGKRTKKRAGTDIAISDEETDGQIIPEQVCTFVLLLPLHLCL
jgi:hypothetical protein